MIAEVLWEKQAQSDREDIFRYLYQEAGLLVASATDDKFVSLAEMLRINSEAGAIAGRSHKQRKLTVNRFPFIIIYIIEKKQVHILRVLHTSCRISGRYIR